MFFRIVVVLICFLIDGFGCECGCYYGKLSVLRLFWMLRIWFVLLGRIELWIVMDENLCCY